MHPRVATLIQALGLAPHPEGGHFREIHRSTVSVDPGDGRSHRSALTVIHFLLAEGELSRWHRVSSDELWQISEGGPLELLMTGTRGDQVERVLLGTGSDPTSRLHVVPAGRWQAARSVGPYVLVTCTVGPGFDFADFELLADRPEERSRLAALSAELARLV